MKRLTNHQERIARNAIYVAVALIFYVLLVYAYFQFESFGSDQPDVGFGDAVWYVFLNPTGLGSAGEFKFFPSSMPGKLIGVLFALSGLSLIGLFVGKVSDMFNDVRERRRLGHVKSRMTGHVIIIGWDDFSRRVVEQLVRSDRKVAVVTSDRDNVDLIHDYVNEDDQASGDNVIVLYAGFESYELLRRYVNIAEASKVFINRDKDTDTLITLLNLKGEFDECPLDYVVRVKNKELLETFDDDVEAVTTFKMASGLIASHIFEPAVADFGKDLIESVDEECDYELQQYYVQPDNAWARKPFGDMYWSLYEKYGAITLALGKRNGKRRLIKLPDDDVTVEPGDYAVAIVNGQSASGLREEFGVTQGIIHDST